MNSGTEIDFCNPVLIYNLEMVALEKELGAVVPVRFLRQFCQGQGDYIIEYKKLLKAIR